MNTHVRRGFTLIEILVVVAVLAVLIAILIPSLSRARQRSKRTACASNLHQIGLAVLSYRQQNGEHFPIARSMPEPFISGPTEPPLFEALKREISPKSRAYACPGDDGYVHARCGISYVYVTNLSGLRPNDTPLHRVLKLPVEKIPLASDFDGFTGSDSGVTIPFFHLRRNLLFADGHVGEYQLKTPLPPPVSPGAEMTARRRKIALLAATALLAIVGAGIGIAFRPGETEPSINLPHTAEEGFRVAASADFAKLPDYRQEAYRREVHRLVMTLPEDQRQAMFAKYRGSADLVKGIREIGFDPVKTAVQEYYKAPPEKRTAVLDSMIDRMERFRSLGGLGQSRTGPPQPSPELRDLMRQRVESQIQEGNPQESAKTMEFLKQFRQRRIERGLPVP